MYFLCLKPTKLAENARRADEVFALLFVSSVLTSGSAAVKETSQSAGILFFIFHLVGHIIFFIFYLDASKNLKTTFPIMLCVYLFTS